MKKTTKRVWNLFGTIFFSSLVCFGIFSTMTNACTDIDDLDTYEGILVEKGITDNKSSVSGKGIITSQVFYLRLEGLDQLLATYNKEESYYFLDSKLNVGDTVKVYFKYAAYPNRPNLNTYQIDKNGETLLSEEEFKGKELTAGIIAILGLAVLLTIGYFKDKKLRPTKKSGV